MKSYYYVGYGKDNHGIVSTIDSWKRLNGGKRLSKSQLKLLQMKVYKVVKNAGWWSIKSKTIRSR